MTATTPIYGLSYPEGSDLVSTAPDSFKSMADTFEQALDQVDRRSTPTGVKPVIATTLNTLANTTGVTGQTGYVTADATAANNGAYVWTGSAWVKLVTVTDMAVPDLTFRHPDFSIAAYPRRAGNLIVCPIKVIRTGGDWNMAAWEMTGICKIPAGLRPGAGIDINVLGVDNLSTTSPMTGFTINEGEIYFRAFRGQVAYKKNTWTSAILAWRIER